MGNFKAELRVRSRARSGVKSCSNLSISKLTRERVLDIAFKRMKKAKKRTKEAQFL